MTIYSSFIGIDIGKFEIVAGFQGTKATQTFVNTQEGFEDFFKLWKPLLKNAFVVLETTGGYEKLFLENLLKKKVAVHRANTRQVKAFIHSLGTKAKTDALDAIGLARYGFERHDRLALYQPLKKTLETLQGLAQRRLDLIQTLTSEKNRLQAPTAAPIIQESCRVIINTLQMQLDCIQQAMEILLDQLSDLKKQRDILQEIPGVGAVTSLMLTALLPELGHLNRRQIASLTGLAPHPRESGTKIGYRRTTGGRKEIKSILFMAGMAAAHSKSSLGDKFRKMIEAGKKKMVALVAIMRNIIVIANAKIKEFLNKNNELNDETMERKYA